MPSDNLTDAKLKALPKPSNRTDIKDARTSGLSVRVYPSGAKTFRQRFMINGKAKVTTLGHYPSMSLAQARKAAQANHNVISEGRDPVIEKQTMPNVQEFADTYIEKHAKPHIKSWKDYQRTLTVDVLPYIGETKLDKVKRRDMVEILDRVRARGAHSLANHVQAVTRAMFNYAVQRDVIEHNPAQGIKQTQSKPRDVVLGDDAIRTLWSATEADSDPLPLHYINRNVLRLLLLTGARNSEVGGMRLDEIDSQKTLWTIPYERTKNGLTQTVPLSDLAMEVIDKASETAEEGYLFPSRSQAGEVRSIDNYIPSKAMRKIFDGGYTPHDLRRTCATRLSGLGFNRLVIERVLNHKDNSIAAIYDRYSYDSEKRLALDKWCAELRAIVDRD